MRIIMPLTEGIFSWSIQSSVAAVMGNGDKIG
jgi:hypothetical protein